MKPARALSLAQPWAWFMLCLPEPYRKTVENRRSRLGLEKAGTVWIHASAKETGRQWDEACWNAKQQGVPAERVPARRSVPRGAIVGAVTFTGELWEPAWEELARWRLPGQWSWPVTGAVRLSLPVPARGHLGLWRVPPEALAELPELRGRP